MDSNCSANTCTSWRGRVRRLLCIPLRTCVWPPQYHLDIQPFQPYVVPNACRIVPRTNSYNWRDVLHHPTQLRCKYPRYILFVSIYIKHPFDSILIFQPRSQASSRDLDDSPLFSCVKRLDSFLFWIFVLIAEWTARPARATIPHLFVLVVDILCGACPLMSLGGEV